MEMSQNVNDTFKKYQPYFTKIEETVQSLHISPLTVD